MTAQLPSPPNRGLGYIKIRYHNLPKNREIASLGECSSYEYIWQDNGSVLLADLLPDVIFLMHYVEEEVRFAKSKGDFRKTTPRKKFVP